MQLAAALAACSLQPAACSLQPAACSLHCQERRRPPQSQVGGALQLAQWVARSTLPTCAVRLKRLTKWPRSFVKLSICITVESHITSSRCWDYRNREHVDKSLCRYVLVQLRFRDLYTKASDVGGNL